MPSDSINEEALAKTADVVYRLWAVLAYTRIYQSVSGELILDYLDPATQRMAYETHLRAGWSGNVPLSASLPRDKVVQLWDGSDPVAHLVSIAEKLARGRTFTRSLPSADVMADTAKGLDDNNDESNGDTHGNYDQLSEKTQAERDGFKRFVDEALEQKSLPPKQAAALQKRQQGETLGSAAQRVALMAAKKKIKELYEDEERFDLLFGSWVERSDAANLPEVEAEPAAYYQVAAKNEVTGGAVATPSQREGIRHMDVWGTGVVPVNPAARTVWDEAIKLFKTGEQSPKVLDILHTVVHLEPSFLMAKVQTSAVHFRDGKLKQAVGELEEIAHQAEGGFKALVQSNLSDYYVILWERSHRQTRSHLDKALGNAQEAMAYPTPARVVNHIIALSKEGDYEKAKAALLDALQAEHPNAPAHNIVSTLHKVQDKDLKKLYLFMAKK